MATQVSLPNAWMDGIYQDNFIDEFHNVDFTENDRWSTEETDSGSTVAMDADGVNGICLITTGTTDNMEAYLYSTNELFELAKSRGIMVACRLDFTEANTNTANILFGLQNAPGANSLVDNGGGPAASKDFAGIYKIDGETVWRCGAALVADTNPNNKSDESAGRTNSETTDFQSLMIKIEPWGGSRANLGTELAVTYHVDPRGYGGFRQLKDTNGNLIVDKIPGASGDLATTTEMALVVGAKTGAGTFSEVIKLDRVGVFAVR